MKYFLSLAAVAVILVAADKPDDKKADKPTEKKTDKERIQGTWVITALEVDGKEMKDGPTIEALKKVSITYKGDAYIPSMAPDGYTVTFKLDPDKKPATFESEVTFMGAKVVTRQLYELSDDTLRICASTKDATVCPKEFTSKDGQAIVTYKRVEKKPEK